MLQTNDDLEASLTRLERPFERLEDGTYIVKMGADRPLVAVRLAPPVLVMRVAIGYAPAEATPLFRRLLELNATALLHAAYGLEGDRIVLSAALPLENVDLNEIEAVLADIDLALAEHVPSLHELVKSRA